MAARMRNGFIWAVTVLSPLTLATGLVAAPGLWLTIDPTLTELLWLIGCAGSVVLAYVDRRSLARSGVPHPFHWTWSFFTIVNLSLVYVAGRVIIARRSGIGGYAPAWLSAALLVVTTVLGIASAVLIAAVMFFTQPPE